MAISSVWAGLGFSFIIVTAALQSVPRELHESALVDGAGSFRRFCHVTLPMISPTLLFLTVVLTTRALQTYGEISLLTGGGPNDGKSKVTTNIPYLIYGRNSLIRKRRVAAGSGTSVQEVNALLKQFQEMQKMMKQLTKGRGRGLRNLLGGMGGGFGP